MSSDKRVNELDGAALNILNVDAKTEDTTNGKIHRLNRPHAVMLLYDIVNANDDAAAGAMALEFDLYDATGTTIVWSGSLATGIPTTADLKGAVLFGGGVLAAASDGTIHADAGVLGIFDQIRFRVNITTANDDTGTCVVNLRAKVQE